MLQKCATLPEARLVAARLSRETPGRLLFVVESRGTFYVDDSGFIRSWETLHAAYEDGRLSTGD